MPKILDLDWFEIWREGARFIVYSPTGKAGDFPSRTEALQWVASRPDPKRGDRGPIRYARHVAKCLLAEEPK